MIWRMLDLFSGIGGFSLAAQWVWGDELEIVAFCECDKFCQKVLQKHWPGVPIIQDVRDVKTELMAFSKGRKSGEQTEQEGWKNTCGRSEEIDLLTGGFPCQPFSVAGKRKGKEDDRFLWPEMFRVIKEFKPRWVVAENVAGIVRMELDNCLSDLEGEGYSTQTVIIPACAVNAPHRRDRVWIVAHDGSRDTQQRDSSTQRSSQCSSEGGKTSSARIVGGQDFCETFTETRNKLCGNLQTSQDVADSKGKGLEGTNRKRDSCPDGRNLQCPSRDRWSTEPSMGELVNGVSGGLVRFRGRVAKGVSNRVNKLKSLGNAIVPQVAEQIFRAIKQVET